MKTLTLTLTIKTGKRMEAMRFEKTGPDDEIEVLASAVSTIFLKSKEALKMAEKHHDGGKLFLTPKRHAKKR